MGFILSLWAIRVNTAIKCTKYKLDRAVVGKPASVAQLDARPTGDQEVAGSTPAVGKILKKYSLRSFSPFRWFKKGSCQSLAKEYAQYWLTA